jgi:hypothetical protein
MQVTTDLVPSAMPVEESSQTSASARELYRKTIQLGLSQGRNAMGIWQDLVDGYGFAGGYQSVKRFVRKLRGMRSPEARVVIETPPSEEAQVDYGSGPMVRDPQSGKYRRTRMFVLTLGYSRKSVRLLCFAEICRVKQAVAAAEKARRQSAPVELPEGEEAPKPERIWDRDLLEKQVWSEPIRRLATKYGVSDVAIHKQCKKIGITLPGRGYWAKKASQQEP